MAVINQAMELNSNNTTQSQFTSAMKRTSYKPKIDPWLLDISLRDLFLGVISEHSQLIGQLTSTLMEACLPKAENKEEADDVNEIESQMILLKINGIVDGFIKLENRIEQVIEIAKMHQANQLKLDQLKQKVNKAADIVLSIVDQLSRTRAQVNALLDVSYKQIDSYKKADPTKKDISQIINYAQRIQKVTSAPPNFNLQANATAVHAEPPYPDEVKIRQGILAQKSNFITDGIEEILKEDKLDEQKAEEPQIINSFLPTTLATNGFIQPPELNSAPNNSTYHANDDMDQDFYFDLNDDLS